MLNLLRTAYDFSEGRNLNLREKNIMIQQICPGQYLETSIAFTELTASNQNVPHSPDQKRKYFYPR